MRIHWLNEWKEMGIKFDDLETAFSFVSSDQPFMNRACMSKSTGKTYYQSEMGGDFDEWPEDIDENDDTISIPHKNDLGLGQNLVWQFVDREIPGLADKVRSFFSHRGAYSKYKNFLEEIGLLDKWHEFESAKCKEALIQWCKENDIEIDI